METFNGVRRRVWAQQPPEFFDHAILDADGTLVATNARCKQGVDLSYNGIWGYHPLIISLANTAEPLYLVNRGGNRPSHEHAAGYLDKAIDVCRGAGFRPILLRGDTDFTQTAHLDRWDQAGDVHFLFGIDAMPNLKALAERTPGRGVRLPGATATVRDQDRAPPGARTRSRTRSSSSGSSRRSTCSRR